MNNYRLINPDEREKFYQLYLYTFNDSDSKERRAFFNARYAHGWIYGLYDHDQLVSGMYSLPFVVNFHGVNYQMHGIGDVMSTPMFSGQGGAGTLLQTNLEELATNHVTLAYLAPFSYAYYRRFGYEQVFNHMVYKLPHDKVPSYHAKNSTGSLRQLSLKAALPFIMPFYDKHADHLAGGMVRSSWWWDYLTLKRNWDVCLYYDAEDVLKGYVLYERAGEKLIVQEYKTETVDAFENLMQFVLNHRNIFDTLVFDSDDPEYHGDWLADPYSLEAKCTPYMMARIIDLKDFLQRYPYRQDSFKQLTFSVQDDNLSQNTGVWQLSRNEGKTKIVCQSDVTSGSTISIQQLTKAAFGTTSLTKQAQTGKNPWEVSLNTAFDAIFVNSAPRFKDYF